VNGKQRSADPVKLFEHPDFDQAVKSYVIRQVTSLFPPEAVITANQLTPQALFYMPPGSLVHRFLVIGERSRRKNDDTAEATRALREMLSEGRLSKWVTIRANGQPESQRVQQDGPIAYVESTTSMKLFAEDANRCILLTSDEQPEQTRRVLSLLAHTYAHGMTHDRQCIIDRHHAMQRLLRPHVVLVPFAERLVAAIKSDRVEARRAYPQLMSAIQASALLHQRQRDFDEDGRLLANADDYRLVGDLLASPMARQLGGGISVSAARFLERLREWFPQGTIFTRREAAQRESCSKSSVYEWLDELQDTGFVEMLNESQGRTAARLRVAANSSAPDAAAVLPPADDIFC
jgi:hypothetical protein